jgi:hypothetical protein
MRPVVQSFLTPRPGGRAVVLPGDNPGPVVEETELLLGDWNWNCQAVEAPEPKGKDGTYRRLLSSGPARAGRMSPKRRSLETQLAAQPSDGNLVHLDADLCSTWLKAPTRAIESLFGGVFEREGGSMAVTVTANREDISRSESWRRGFGLASFIRDQGLNCLFVPVAYPTSYTKDNSPHRGHLMLRFGYAWFPSQNPSIRIGNPGITFGLDQMHGGDSFSAVPAQEWTPAALRRRFSGAFG